MFCTELIRTIIFWTKHPVALSKTYCESNNKKEPDIWGFFISKCLLYIFLFQACRVLLQLPPLCRRSNFRPQLMSLPITLKKKLDLFLIGHVAILPQFLVPLIIIQLQPIFHPPYWIQRSHRVQINLEDVIFLLRRYQVSPLKWWAETSYGALRML